MEYSISTPPHPLVSLKAAFFTKKFGWATAMQQFYFFSLLLSDSNLPRKKKKTFGMCSLKNQIFQNESFSPGPPHRFIICGLLV